MVWGFVLCFFLRIQKRPEGPASVPSHNILNWHVERYDPLCNSTNDLRASNLLLVLQLRRGDNCPFNISLG